MDHLHGKLRSALNDWEDWREQYEEATEWTARQLEDVAIGLYGPYAGQGTYWVWDNTAGQWVVTNQTDLRDYVESVRDNPEN